MKPFETTEMCPVSCETSLELGQETEKKQKLVPDKVL